jgi:hypothetical protein
VILRVDSLAGRPLGSIQDRAENGHGPFQEELFGKLRPGESTIIGPHSDGSYAVIKLISRSTTRQLTFDEAGPAVVDAARATKSEALLQQLVERLASRMRILARPELLILMDLTDPADEITLD